MNSHTLFAVVQMYHKSSEIFCSALIGNVVLCSKDLTPPNYEAKTFGKAPRTKQIIHRTERNTEKILTNAMKPKKIHKSTNPVKTKTVLAILEIV